MGYVKKRINVICGICGNKFITSRTQNKYCSTSCRDEISKRRYREKPNAPTWLSIMEFINERDGYECKHCGSGNRLAVHHITPLSSYGTNDPDNLITLCYICHSKEHWINTK